MNRSERKQAKRIEKSVERGMNKALAHDRRVADNRAKFNAEVDKLEADTGLDASHLRRDPYAPWWRN